MTVIIDCIGLTQKQKEAGSILLGGRNTRFVDVEPHKILLQKAHQAIQKQVEAQPSSVYESNYEVRIGARSLESLQWLKDSIDDSSISIVGNWGDPFTEIVIDLVANIRANLNYPEESSSLQDEILRFPQIFYNAKHDRYTDASGNSIWNRPRDELNPPQEQAANDLQLLANSYQSLRVLSFFGDWFMEFHCIPRYMWLYVHELERQMHHDCFRFTEFNPIQHFLDVNATAPITNVTMLPWDDSAFELFHTLMAQHVNRPTFCTLDMVVLHQMMGMKLTPPTIAEIIT